MAAGSQLTSASVVWMHGAIMQEVTALTECGPPTEWIIDDLVRRIRVCRMSLDESEKMKITQLANTLLMQFRLTITVIFGLNLNN